MACISLPKYPLALVQPTRSKSPSSRIISFLFTSSNSQFNGLRLPNLTTYSSPRPFSPRTLIHAKFFAEDWIGLSQKPCFPECLRIPNVAKGDVPPPFTLKDQNGRNVSLTRFKGKPVVVYFYPADETPGCTKEACAFRDSYEKFKKARAEVVGISGDDPASHKAFATKYGLPFTLLSDEGNTVRKEWGVPSDLFGVLPGRQTYVIDRKGVVQLVYNNQFQPEKHVEETLKLLRSL